MAVVARGLLARLDPRVAEREAGREGEGARHVMHGGAAAAAQEAKREAGPHAPLRAAEQAAGWAALERVAQRAQAALVDRGHDELGCHGAGLDRAERGARPV